MTGVASVAAPAPSTSRSKDSGRQAAVTASAADCGASPTRAAATVRARSTSSMARSHASEPVSSCACGVEYTPSKRLVTGPSPLG